MSFLLSRSLVFLDTETSGLDARKHCMLEVAAAKFSPKTLLKISDFESLVKPHSTAVIDPHAMEVHKIATEVLNTAPDERYVLLQFLNFIKGSILIGHNLNFDMNFIRAACVRQGLDLADYMSVQQTLDTQTLAWPLLANGTVKSISLKNLCEHFSIDNAGAHRAMTDVLRTYAVYKKLLGVV